MQTIPVKTIRENLDADTVSCKDGCFTVRRGFFYTHGKTAQDFANDVINAFPLAVIVSKGEVWRPFRGGATIAQGSHWYVKFTIAASIADKLAVVAR